MKKDVNFDLEDRLVDFAVRCLTVSKSLPDTKAGSHICGQLVRSGTSPAPNYGEAQSAESRADFIHKLKISLKELRETRIWLKIIIRAGMISESKLKGLIEETNELISIFVKSVETARKNMQKEKRS